MNITAPAENCLMRKFFGHFSVKLLSCLTSFFFLPPNPHFPNTQRN